MDHNNWGKYFKRWEYETTRPASWEICMQVKKKQLELDMDQWTSSKLKSVLVSQSCQTLCDPMDCSPPGSSIHRILQARILEWVATSFSRGIFLAQGLNPGLPHCGQTLYWLSPRHQIGRGVRQGYILLPAYLTYMQITLCKMLGWRKNQLESKF